MAVVIDLCSDDAEPTRDLPPKQPVQKSTQHNPPVPTNAKGHMRFPPHKPTIGGRSHEHENSPGRNGISASVSTRRREQGPVNRAKPSQLPGQRQPPSGPSTPRAESDRLLPGKSAGKARSAHQSSPDRKDLQHQPSPSAPSSDEGAMRASFSKSAQGRVQSGSHKFDKQRSHGPPPFNRSMLKFVPELCGGLSASKATGGQAAQLSTNTNIRKFGVIDLTQEDDINQRPAKKRRLNGPGAQSNVSLSWNGTPRKDHDIHNQPSPVDASSKTPKYRPGGLPTLDSLRSSANLGNSGSLGDVVSAATSSPVIVPSVEHHHGIPRQATASSTPRSPSSRGEAITLDSESLYGCTPKKSGGHGQKSFVGRTSTRSSEVRERRSTIPESPPLSPMDDAGTSKLLTNKAQPGSGSAKPSTEPEVNSHPSAVAENDQNGLRMLRKGARVAHLPKSLPSSVSRRVSGEETSQSHVSSLAGDLDEYGTQAQHNDWDYLLQSDARAQNTQIANQATKRRERLRREVSSSQEQQVNMQRKAQRSTASSPDPSADDRAVAVLEQRTSRTSPQLASRAGLQPASAPATALHAIERSVGHYVEEMRDDNEYWTRIELQRARVTSRLRANVQSPGQATSVFGLMTPIPLHPVASKGVPAGCSKLSIEIHPSTSKTERQSYFAPYTTYNTSNTPEVRAYCHYVSISNSLLANNVTSLQHCPYFGDDFDLSKAFDLEKEYYVDIDDRERKLLRLGQAESFAPYVEDLIEKIGCTWSDVLSFLLEEKPDVGTSADAHKALRDRKPFLSEDFIRDGSRWGRVLEKLPTPSPENVGRAAVLCDHFQRIAKFSFWHMVRRSAYTKQLVAEAADVQTESQLTCRVCMRFNCPYHGEIRDHTTDQEPADNQIVETDIILPQVVNWRIRVPFPETVDSEPSVQEKRRNLEYWDKGPFASLRWKADERDPFYPCHHPGTSCSDARCSCFDARVACEKSCGCGPGCKRKWQGCLCHRGKRPKGKSVCWEDDRCACWQKSRECDPDLCGDCGVADVLDPVHRHDESILQNRCGMASLQRGVAKHTIVGDSGVHGLGLYACEDIRVDEFVGEYKGETITKEEADRRGAVYEHQKLCYLFTLNRQQEIDSTYFGNKTRFINHIDGFKSNLRPLISMVNTVFRIGMYAKKNIRAGEEFFFDYGPSFPKDQLGGGKAARPPKSSQSVPHVRNSGLVLNNFYDIDFQHDQVGNVRATKKAIRTGSASSEDGGGQHRPRSHAASLNTRAKRRILISSETSSSTSEQHDDGDRPGAGGQRKESRPVDEADDVTAMRAGSAQHRNDHAEEVSSEDDEFDPDEDSANEAGEMSIADE